MRLSNLWEKFRLVAVGAFGAAAALFCIHEVYSAVTDGTVMCLGCRPREWITFHGRPGFYVFSIIIYLFMGALLLVGFCAWILSVFPTRGRWRSRQFFDDAIRQKPQER